MGKRRISISQLAKMAGVSVRTLRYYDEIGLLVPLRGENGYREYGDDEIHSLQQIMLLRSCGLPLVDIADALSKEDFDLKARLRAHLVSLEDQSIQLAQTMNFVRMAINGLEDFKKMTDEERFERLKRDSVKRFESEYGTEARRLYGDKVIDDSNERMLSMSKLAWDAKEELEQRVKGALVAAMATSDTSSPESRMLAELHAQWIRVHWGEDGYSPDAHKQLAKGYLDDQRFVDYYDGACGEGATKFLAEVIEANA